MTKYSVKQLSNLAGVSVRTLHHYDQIGLLKPSFRSEKGYRFYERKELLRLQQILFYRKLGFPLKEIHSIINEPSFDLLEALKTHKKQLKKQMEDLKLLLKTVDKTIIELKSTTKMMTDKEMYEGFTSEQVIAIKKEVKARWGEDQLREVEERIQKMGKEGWQDNKKKGEEINQLLADLMDLGVDHVKVQKAIALHFRHMNGFYEVSKERYLGLGGMYIADQRFTDYYDKYKPGLAVFINSAIHVFCKNGLKIIK